MQQDAKILPVHAELAAYIVLVSFLQENRFKEPAIPRLQLRKHFADICSDFFRDQRSFDIDYFIGSRRINMLLPEGLGSVQITSRFAQYIPAD